LRILLATFGLGIMLNMSLQYTDNLAAMLWGREWIAIVLISAVGAGVYGGLALLLGAARPSDYKTISGKA
jgi:putative peptidoglycan lipid II flippase